MKLVDVYAPHPKTSRSPIGSIDPQGLTIDMVNGDESEGDIIYVARNKYDEPVARVELHSWIIVDMTLSKKSYATPVMNRVCDAADQYGVSVYVPLDGIKGVSDKRFLERFGFLTTSDDVMERKPGAALPYSVI